MSLKKLGLALLAILALGAVFANSALATAEESNGFWYGEGTKLAAGVKSEIVCSQVGEATLSTTVGTNNTPLKLKATATECPGAVIFNESSKAKATGKIKFTGVTVVEPAGCSVVGGEVETEPLKGQIYMKGTKVLFMFSPVSGEIFAEPEIAGCAIAGGYPTKGVVFGESTNATNFEAEEQFLNFSAAINSAAGGSLTFGGHSASITGKTKFITTKIEGGITKHKKWKVNLT